MMPDASSLHYLISPPLLYQMRRVAPPWIYLLSATSSPGDTLSVPPCVLTLLVHGAPLYDRDIRLSERLRP